MISFSIFFNILSTQIFGGFIKCLTLQTNPSMRDQAPSIHLFTFIIVIFFHFDANVMHSSFTIRCNIFCSNSTKAARQISNYILSLTSLSKFFETNFPVNANNCLAQTMFQNWLQIFHIDWDYWVFLMVKIATTAEDVEKMSLATFGIVKTLQYF